MMRLLIFALIMTESRTAMKNFKLMMCAALLLLVSLACAITVPIPGDGAPQAATQAGSPTPVITPSRTPRPSSTPFPTPTRRPTSADFATAFSEKPVTLPASLTPALAVETVENLGNASFTPTRSFVNLSATPPALKCEVEVMRPLYGEDFKPRTDFLAAWRLYNVGTALWPAGEVSFVYVEGDKLHSAGYVPEFVSFTVFPKDRIRFDIHLRSPKEPGRYITTWGMKRSVNKAPFCLFSITIDVVK